MRNASRRVEIQRVSTIPHLALLPYTYTSINQHGEHTATRDGRGDTNDSLHHLCHPLPKVDLREADPQMVKAVLPLFPAHPTYAPPLPLLPSRPLPHLRHFQILTMRKM